MSTNDLRQASRDSAQLAYMTFIHHVREDKNGLFCFFEGKDSPYYRPRITQIFEGNYFPIRCSGKKKVIETYDLISPHREYDNYKKAFFVDSDFEPKLNNSAIYETPCYSIENLYTSKKSFGEILKSEWGISEVEDDFEKCTNLYENLQQEFHQKSTLFNAWYACLIDIRTSTQQKVNVNLDDKILGKFVTISLDSVSANYTVLDLKTKYPNAPEIDEETLQNKILNFEIKDKRLIFRGKFEIYFKFKVLEGLIKDSKNTKKYISKPIKKYNIDYNMLINQFSQYAETPDCLIEYLTMVVNN